MSLKYYISFTSELGKDCRVEFYIDGYVGDPIELDGSGCSILYDGDDLFAPIITSKASLSVNYNAQFLSDTRDADDKQIPVTIYHGNKKWIGFLIADNRDETFDKTNYEVQLTCVDPFSYIRGLQKDLFRDTNLFGIHSIEDVIKAVFNPVLGEVNINVLNDMVPTGKSGNIINATYCYSQAFTDENGIFFNGYDIIEKIMSDLIMTAIFHNGILVLRNNKFLESAQPVEIGLNEQKDSVFWIENSELITRSRGKKETSSSFKYPDQVSFLSNPNFYFFNGSVVGWTLKTTPWYDCTGIEYVGTGRERNPYGFKLTGLMKDNTIITEGKDSGPLAATSIFNFPVPTALDPANYVLKIRFKYGRYPIVLDSNGNAKKLNLAVNLICRDLGGTGKVLAYFNEGKTGVGEYSVSQWEDGWDTGQSYPRIYFPVENNEEIQEVEIGIAGIANMGLTGPFVFDVLLWNMGGYNNNNSIIADGGGYSAFPQSVFYYSADMFVTREGKAYYNGNNSIDKYSQEEIYITNPKDYSDIDDTKELTVSRAYYTGFRDSNGDLQKNIDKYNRGSLLDSDGEAIETFTQGSKTASLLEMGASSNMYYNRSPRSIIEGTIRGDVNIIDVLESPKTIPGKYVCVKDEYDLYDDTHSMTLHELKGSEDDNDIIENLLSSE